MADLVDKIRYALIARRTELGLSQKEVASLMGVTQGRMSQIETGRFAEARISTFVRWADALGMVIEIVADGDGYL